MKTAIIALAVLALMLSTASARTSSGSNTGSGGSHYSGRYGPARSFSTSSCVKSTCFAKHPSGTYTHPNTGGMRTP